MVTNYLALCAALIAALALTACGGGDPESLKFDISVQERAVVGGSDTFVARQGDMVTLQLSSDERGTLHLHGYDVSTGVTASQQVSVTVHAADIGIFPLGLHFTDAAGSAAHGGGGHHAGTIEAPAGMGVGLEVHPDAVSGYNIRIVTEGFRFAPEHASGDHVPGEGHAHLYVNGEKISRLYGEWLHLSALPDGAHEVRVTLNANSHEQYAVLGEPLQAMTMIQQGATSEGHQTGGHEGAPPTVGVAEITIGVLEVHPR